MSDVSPSEYMVALSPSVNAQTRHPRYHSFYAFLFDEFWRRDDLSRDHASLKEFFRPRDWAYSLAAQFCPEHGEMGGIVGSGTTRRLGASDAASFTFDPGYIQADLGGYELNYATPIAQLGFLYPGGVGMPTPVTIPSERGKELAAAFRKEIEHTAYYREYFGRDHVDVPREVFKEYAASGCLCYGKHTAAADRGILLDAFLHAGEEGRAHARRQSMRLFLDIARQTDGVKLSEPGFRELLFFGASSGGARYRPADGLAAHAVRWRYYQAREFYVYAVNGLFSHLCEWGRAAGGDVWPLPLQEVWSHLDEALDFDSLANLLGVDAPGLGPESPYDNLLSWLCDMAGAQEGEFDAACTLEAQVQESRLHRLAESAWERECVQLSGMLTLLASIYLRYSDPALQAHEQWRFARFGEPDRLSIARFIADVRGRLDEGGLTIGAFARLLMAEYVIRQHQVVAYRKLPEDTFRLRYEEGGLRFFSDPALDSEFGFNDSRFSAMGGTVHELGLCGSLSAEDHGLTDGGRRLLEEGDLL